MVTKDECSYADETEESNVTSLQSDNSCTVDSEPKDTRYESTNKEQNSFGSYESKDCKCYEVHPTINFGAATETYAMPEKVEQSAQQKLLKEQPASRQFQSTIPCLCHVHKINGYNFPVKYKRDVPYSRPLWCRFKWKWPRKGYFDRKDKTYEVQLKQKQCSHYAKPFICCEISEGIPNKNNHKPTPDKPKSPKYKEKMKIKDEPTEKIDIYYFDHGNSAYYRTTDSPPILTTERCAEKTDQAATRFWAEIFGTIHIGTAFVTAFILQLLRFVLFSIIRPLTVGILQLLADYFIKPCLSIVFNALVQPFLILFYNIATSLKDLCEPLAEALGLFLREIANLCAAIRIVEVRHANAQQTCT